ncbi:MAG: DHHA1 domain-containing protein [Actinomycetota bacterium]|nr:DHHA1 domain-containing protein [Actinomycetota bacterium]
MSKTYVLWHGGCPDGFGAAYAAWRRLGSEAEYVPVRYGEDPPAMESGSRVYILDFSYPRDVLLELNEKHVWLKVLDHHVTAEEDLEGLPFAEFDMDHSGAVMAWNHFCAGWPVPKLLRYVEDRDLWRWALPHSREINAAIASYPQDFATWDGITRLCVNEVLRSEGRAILRAQKKAVDRICAGATLIPLETGDPLGALVNTPAYVSEVGEELLKRHEEAEYAVMYHITSDGGWSFSLRSRGDFDVSKLARRYGGGGHKAAAGFRKTPHGMLALEATP